MATAAGRGRSSRGIKDMDMLQWLRASSSDAQPNDNGVFSPFSLLSASAYVITRIQLHAAFSIYFQAMHAILLLLLCGR